jgi:probable rRNA maturation factor
MGVLIDNRQKKYRISQKKIRKKAQAILDALGSPEAELSLVLVDDNEIAGLNRNYLNREGPTNVIAFPMRAGEFAKISPQLLGDVVISLETAERESRPGEVSFEERVDQLLIHGILHLFGYDHVNSADEARRMDGKSTKLAEIIKKI